MAFSSWFFRYWCFDERICWKMHWRLCRTFEGHRSNLEPYEGWIPELSRTMFRTIKGLGFDIAWGVERYCERFISWSDRSSSRELWKWIIAFSNQSSPRLSKSDGCNPKTNFSTLSIPSTCNLEAPHRGWNFTARHHHLDKIRFVVWNGTGVEPHSSERFRASSNKIAISTFKWWIFCLEKQTKFGPQSNIRWRFDCWTLDRCNEKIFRISTPKSRE